MANELLQAEEAATKVTESIAETVAQAKELSATLRFPNAGQYAEADNAYNELHRAWSHGEDKRKELTGPLNEVIKKLNSIFKSKLDPLEELKRTLKRTMDRYATDELIWKREEQRKVDAAAKKKAEDEQLKRAEDLEKHGNNKAAEVVINQPTVALKTQVTGATDEGNSSVKTVWKAEVVNVKLFLNAVADGIIPLTAIEIKGATLDRMAQAAKGQLQFPGVEFKEVASVGARR